MRVLVVRLGAFGDIVHTLPLAADLRAAGHRVGWICEDRWADLLRHNPVVDAVHLFPRKAIRGGPWAERAGALRACLRAVRGAAYDAVIDAQGLAKSAALAIASAAPERVGHAWPRAREGSWLAMRRRVAPEATHVIDQQRALAAPLGAPSTGSWRFPLPPWEVERRWADDWLASRSLASPWLLNVGAGWPTKVWPEERQAQLARLLAERRTPLVYAWGSAGERSAAERIAAAAGWGELAPPTSIPQLGALISRSAVMVSGDTGPLHLALALGTPALGLFGPVPAERNGPRGPGYRCLQAPGAAWERRDVSKVDMGAITAEAALAAADAALGDRRGGSGGESPLKQTVESSDPADHGTSGSSGVGR
jgi:lipopolysaccharide heptosyltransferase I